MLNLIIKGEVAREGGLTLKYLKSTIRSDAWRSDLQLSNVDEKGGGVKILNRMHTSVIQACLYFCRASREG